MKWHTQINSTGSLDLTPQQKISLSRFSGKKAIIEIPKKTRTGAQNRYYWFYLGIIEAETGNTASDLHETFKRTLLPPRFITTTIKGKEQEIKIPASTTKLSKIDMGDYLEKICAETNVPIPDPATAGFVV